MRMYRGRSYCCIAQSGVGRVLCAVILLASIFVWFDVLNVFHPIEHQHMSVGKREKYNANLRGGVASLDVFQDFEGLGTDGGRGDDDGGRTRPNRMIEVDFQQESGGCEVGLIPYGVCKNDQQRVRLVGELPACRFPVHFQDVVFGVWHSLNTEQNLVPLIQTWGKHQVQIVLLASTTGARNSKLFQDNTAPGSNPLLLDTGLLEDYFSTLGKALIGQKMMTELYPKAKWFAIVGDDNYIHMDRYLRLLRGAGILTSIRLASDLAPHLEPFFRDIYESARGNWRKTPKEDKFHDMAFQALVERKDGVIYHLNALLDLSPGFFFSLPHGTPLGPATEPLQHITQWGNFYNPRLPAVFHLVRGPYLLHLHDLSNVYTCNSVNTQPPRFSICALAVGIYQNNRSLSEVDETRIRNTWGKAWDGPGHLGLICWTEREEGILTHYHRIQELLSAFPYTEWFLLVSADNYVVLPNIALRINALEEYHEGRSNNSAIQGKWIARKMVLLKPQVIAENEHSSDEGPILISRELAEAIVHMMKGPLSGEKTVEQVAEDIAPGSVVLDPAMIMTSSWRRKAKDEDDNDTAIPLSAAVVISTSSNYSLLRPDARKREPMFPYEIAHFIIKNGEGGPCHALFHNVDGLK